MKGKIDKLTMKVDISKLSVTDRTRREKTSKNTKDMTNISNQVNLIDISRTFHLTTAENTLFSSANET